MKVCKHQSTGGRLVKCDCKPNEQLCMPPKYAPSIAEAEKRITAGEIAAKAKAADKRLQDMYDAMYMGLSAVQKVFKPAPVRGNQLPEDDAKRGEFPMADGLLDYFPNALAEVSKVSFKGSQKHNVGQPMHWARGKSTNHRDKIIRHTIDSRDDTEAAIEHAANAAWRALALLQEKIEKVRGIQMSGASK